MVIRRGQVWWADLDEPMGSEPGDSRPVLVLQRDEVNASRISTIVVCLLSSNLRLASAPGNTLLPKKLSGLQRDSVVNASQVLTIDRSRCDRLLGSLPRAVMAEVDRGIAWFLQLDS